MTRGREDEEPKVATTLIFSILIKRTSCIIEYRTSSRMLHCPFAVASMSLMGGVDQYLPCDIEQPMKKTALVLPLNSKGSRSHGLAVSCSHSDSGSVVNRRSTVPFDLVGRGRQWRRGSSFSEPENLTYLFRTNIDSHVPLFFSFLLDRVG